MRQALCAALATEFLLAAGLITLVFGGCATPYQAFKHGMGARAKPADLCSLTVVNKTPYTFKFRVGHLWWEEQKGLLPRDSTGVHPMLIEQDEEHVLVREFYMGGRKRRNVYTFYLPKGTNTHTLVFGGMQHGIVMNHSRSQIRFLSPYGPGKPYPLNPGGYAKQVPMMPGTTSIQVEYEVGSGVWRSASVPVTIDEVKGNAAFVLRGEAQTVDWTLVITNQMLK